jgi:hypothetical protein
VAGELPANELEILWRRPTAPLSAGADAGPAAPPHLYRLVNGVRTELEISTVERAGLVHVRPLSTLEAGTKLLFTWDENCRAPLGVEPADGGVARGERELTVAAAAPRPTLIGTLRAEVTRGPIAKGQCAEAVDAAYADLTIELSEPARPYANMLRYELHVDGVVAPSYFEAPVPIYEDPPAIGESSLGRGKERIFVVCGASPTPPPYGAISSGKHRVRMVARLPDDSELPSNELDVDLRCDIAPTGPGDAGLPQHLDGGHQSPRPGSPGPLAADAGPPMSSDQADASIAPASPQTADEVQRSEETDGCQLSAGNKGGGYWLSLLLLLVMAAWRRGVRQPRQ